MGDVCYGHFPIEKPNHVMKSFVVAWQGNRVEATIVPSPQSLTKEKKTAYRCLGTSVCVLTNDINVRTARLSC